MFAGNAQDGQWLVVGVPARAPPISEQRSMPS